MKVLFKLYYLKLKGQIRNIFKKKSTGIFTILAILLYGMIFVANLSLGGSMIQQMSDVHIMISIAIGFIAIMIFSILLQSRKALFYEQDAYYLFSGPFNKNQINAYLMLQTLGQSLLIALFGIYLASCFASGLGLTWQFLLLMFVVFALMVYFFLVLVDYLYILSITNKKYYLLSKIVSALLIISLLLTYVVYFIEHHNFSLIDFIQNQTFYFIPIFGWSKLLLISYVEHNYFIMLQMFALLLACLGIVVYLFISFQGDYLEQALLDSHELTKKMKEYRAGNRTALQKDKKVKAVKSDFKKGAWAILSKNILISKKTNTLITKNEILVLIIYIVASLVSELGFGFFIYMMIIYLFASLQQSDLVQDLKNYQIYLIPDKPLRKLLAVIIPQIVKSMIICTISIVIMALFYHESIQSTIYYLLTMFGYIMVFVSSTVLSLRFLKSRSNQVFENIMRMFVMMTCSLPGVILTIVFMTGVIQVNQPFMITAYASLICNIVISILIIFSCQSMMNGRELNDD